jgi:succinylglutamic semialdehyde dehydrogenase
MAELLISYDPSTGAEVWRGAVSSPADCDRAMRSARAAFRGWAHREQAERSEIVRAFAEVIRARKSDLSAAISAEVGKPPWEADAEVDLVAAKVEISIEALDERRATFTAGPAVTRFRPHGICGHIVPALLAGNCVVFKPSEHAPAVAELLVDAWSAAGLPDGVLRLAHGGRRVAEDLLDHPDLDGVFLTGSAATGLAIHRRFAGDPSTILALELGGNNPLVVHGVADRVAAAYLTTLSAFLTAGQRCTCARRLVVPEGPEGDLFVQELVAMIGRIEVGGPTRVPQPLIGPVISAQAADAVVDVQRDLVSDGGRVLIECRHLSPGTGLLSPGLIDVTGVGQRRDEEVFGPLLQLIRTVDADAAIQEASRTAYGLAAGILTDDEELYRRFALEVQAGVVNWNHELVGASSRAPFGGVGLSGNHRPSALFAADYCSYPVASIEHRVAALPAQPMEALLPSRP